MYEFSFIWAVSPPPIFKTGEVTQSNCNERLKYPKL